MGRVQKKLPARIIGGGGKRDEFQLRSQFVVRNSCGASVKSSWFAKGFAPKTLTVFFKKLDPEPVGSKDEAEKLNIVEFLDNVSGDKIKIDLLAVPEEYSNKPDMADGINSTVLLLKYLRAKSDEPASRGHRMELRPGEVRAYDFDSQGAGTYLLFLGIGCDENQSEHWYFRRVNLSKNKSYEISFRQEAGKLSGLSRVKRIPG